MKNNFGWPNILNHISKQNTGKIWIAILVLMAVVFMAFTSEVQESDAGLPEFVGHFDKVVMASLIAMRSPTLNNIMTEISALGSFTILTLAVLLGVMLLSFSKNYFDCAYLLLAMIGTGLLSQLMKAFYERPRPPVADRLIQVNGFSYPSGHSLGSTVFYLILAFILAEHLKARSQRFVIFSVSIILILLIGLSRVYLGVHYPTDVIAGLLLGSIWAVLSIRIKLAFKR